MASRRTALFSLAILTAAPVRAADPAAGAGDTTGALQSGPQGLRFRDVVVGDGEAAAAGELIRVAYSGTLSATGVQYATHATAGRRDGASESSTSGLARTTRPDAPAVAGAKFDASRSFLFAVGQGEARRRRCRRAVVNAASSALAHGRCASARCAA